MKKGHYESPYFQRFIVPFLFLERGKEQDEYLGSPLKYKAY